MRDLGYSRYEVLDILEDQGITSTVERFNLIDGHFTPDTISFETKKQIKRKLDNVPESDIIRQLKRFTTRINRAELQPIKDYDVTEAQFIIKEMSLEDFKNQRYAEGGEVTNVSQVKEKPEDRLNPFTNEPYSNYEENKDRVGLVAGSLIRKLFKKGFNKKVYHGTLADVENFEKKSSDLGTHVGTSKQADARIESKIIDDRMGDAIANRDDDLNFAYAREKELKELKSDPQVIKGVQEEIERLEESVKLEDYSTGSNTMPLLAKIENSLELPDIGEWRDLNSSIEQLLESPLVINADGTKNKNIINKLRRQLKNVQRFESKYEDPRVFWVSPEAKKIRAKIVNIIKSEGYDSIKYKNIHESGLKDIDNTSYIIFDSKNIRSEFAEFDPAKAKSERLLDYSGGFIRQNKNEGGEASDSEFIVRGPGQTVTTRSGVPLSSIVNTRPTSATPESSPVQGSVEQMISDGSLTSSVVSAAQPPSTPSQSSFLGTTPTFGGVNLLNPRNLSDAQLAEQQQEQQELAKARQENEERLIAEGKAASEKIRADQAQLQVPNEAEYWGDTEETLNWVNPYEKRDGTNQGDYERFDYTQEGSGIAGGGNFPLTFDRIFSSQWKQDIAGLSAEESQLYSGNASSFASALTPDYWKDTGVPQEAVDVAKFNWTLKEQKDRHRVMTTNKEYVRAFSLLGIDPNTLTSPEALAAISPDKKAAVFDIVQRELQRKNQRSKPFGFGDAMGIAAMVGGTVALGVGLAGLAGVGPAATTTLTAKGGFGTLLNALQTKFGLVGTKASAWASTAKGGGGLLEHALRAQNVKGGRVTKDTGGKLTYTKNTVQQAVTNLVSNSLVSPETRQQLEFKENESPREFLYSTATEAGYKNVRLNDSGYGDASRHFGAGLLASLSKNPKLAINLLNLKERFDPESGMRRQMDRDNNNFGFNYDKPLKSREDFIQALKNMRSDLRVLTPEEQRMY